MWHVRLSGDWSVFRCGTPRTRALVAANFGVPCVPGRKGFRAGLDSLFSTIRSLFGYGLVYRAEFRSSSRGHLCDTPKKRHTSSVVDLSPVYYCNNGKDIACHCKFSTHGTGMLPAYYYTVSHLSVFCWPVYSCRPPLAFSAGHPLRLPPCYFFNRCGCLCFSF